MIRIRFATRVLLLQLMTVASVVAICTAVFIGLTIEQLKAEAEQSALSISRTMASNADVRAEVAAEAADDADPDAEQLSRGTLQVLATEASISTGALFIVITDDEGIRLAHPNPDRLNEKVSTSFDATLRGEETVAWETGTLGASARAKVPIFAPDSTTPVGEVSVGFERASVYDRLPNLLFGVAVGAVAALIVGVIAALIMRRHWEKTTLGIQPEELIALVKNHTAVLDGIDEGVIALRPDGIIDLYNHQAEDILGVGPLKGRSLIELGLPPSVTTELLEGQRHDAVFHKRKILYLDPHSVDRAHQKLGQVITIRDRTDLLALSERLDSVRSMTRALRAQRHEFANRMHTATGLIDAGRTHDAAEFLRDMRDHGPLNYPLSGAENLGEAFLRAYLGALSIETSERGVALRINQDTLILGTAKNVEDIATVVGNLINNATEAATKAPEPRWVDLTLMDDKDILAIIISDSGPGIEPGQDIFSSSPSISAEERSDIHGHGIGLKLCQDLTRRLGGDIWVIDNGGAPGKGAVITAILPTVMEVPTTVMEED